MKRRKLNGDNSSAPAHLKPTAVTLLGLLTALVAGLAPIDLIAAGPPYALRVVAYLGDAAPGGGAFVNNLKPTALNNRGQLAFGAEPDTPGKEAIFVADGDELTEIVRFGQSAPGGGVFGTTKSGDIVLNDPGDIAFGFTLEEEGESVYRWSHQHQTLSAVVVPNVTPVPDGSGVFVGTFGYPSINNQADIAFLGNVTNPPPTSFTFINFRTGIFVADRFGSITTVAKPGNPAPGGGTFISAGAMYGTIFGFLFTIVTIGVDINDAGDVAFPAQVSTAPNSFTGYVRRFASGVLEAVPPAPGVVTGFVDRVSINNQMNKNQNESARDERKQSDIPPERILRNHEIQLSFAPAGLGGVGLCNPRLKPWAIVGRPWRDFEMACDECRACLRRPAGLSWGWPMHADKWTSSRPPFRRRAAMAGQASPAPSPANSSPQDPNDEPASALLERVETQHESQSRRDDRT